MPKSPYFEHLPSGEDPTEETARALEMARPQRGEIKIPDLTPEEKARLRSLLEQAQKAEKENRLQDAINLYQQLKADFLAIKAQKEKTGSETTIIAQTPEGREISFDLKEIREHWANFYQEHNLEAMAESIPETINLTPEQIQRIQELAQTEGFNRFLLLPPNPDQYLAEIREETVKSLKGLSEDHQYASDGTYLSDSVKLAFPDNITTLNRPETKAYLVFLKDSPEVDPETLDKAARALREELQAKNLQGLTLTEYLLFQRDFAQRHKEEAKPHPDKSEWSWLLDSELASGEVLAALWRTGEHQVEVYSDTLEHSTKLLGCRSSAVLEL